MLGTQRSTQISVVSLDSLEIQFKAFIRNRVELFEFTERLQRAFPEEFGEQTYIVEIKTEDTTQGMTNEEYSCRRKGIEQVRLLIIRRFLDFVEPVGTAEAPAA